MDSTETVKGNVDAELVLHAAVIEYANYHRAIIVSGDGDFACLGDYLIEKDKLLRLITPNERYSQLLKPYSSYIVQTNRLKETLGHKKTSIGVRSKP